MLPHRFHMHSLLVSFILTVAQLGTNLMDNVSQLFAVGEYGLTDGTFRQLEKPISGRTTMSPVRNATSCWSCFWRFGL